MKTESLSVSVLRLARSAGEIAKRMRERGQIRKVKVPYIKEKFEKFEYKEGMSSFASTTEQIVKEEWNWTDLFKYVEPEIKKIKNFSQVVKQISSIFKVSRNQAEFWVSRFLNVVTRESLNDASEDRITELTFSFMKDLEGSSKLWTPIIWLEGIWMVDDVLQLSNNIIFRKPTPSDVEREWDLRSLPYIMDGWPRSYPRAILEMSLRARQQPEVSRELARLILALRLFRVGSVLNIRTFWRSQSILFMGGTSFTSHVTPATYKYSLSKIDIPKLEKFMEIILPLIPIRLIEPGADQVDYSVIAIQRYNDAILKPEIPESRLSFAVMALESLYLKEMEREELERRLGQRVARFLSFYGHKPLEVYNTLKRSYDIRSSFVHGSPIPKEKMEEVSKLTEKILEYVRLSIMLFLQLKSKYDKDKFLSLIDNSLLSKEAFDKFEGVLKENCTI